MSYLCLNCGNVFDEPVTGCNRVPCGDEYVNEEYSACPHCHDSDIVESHECPTCKKHIPSDLSLCEDCTKAVQRKLEELRDSLGAEEREYVFYFFDKLEWI